MAADAKASKDGTKVVIRLLPPIITEEEFLATIPAVHKERMTWRRFHKGKRYKAEAKPSRNSLCYAQFDTADHAEKFLADYHGHSFIDDKGDAFRAVCCLSPYQKVPSKNRRSDNREGSIEEDPFFIDFQEQLAGPKGEYVPPIDPKDEKPKDYGDTPLLHFMLNRARDRQKRAEKRARRWEEEGRHRKWRCAECGTSKKLEEDPENVGVFYCLYCWEYWEYDDGKKKKKKKKKASKDEEWDEGYVETSKKSKKKKKAEDEWWEEGYAEEETGKKKKKKKKAADDEWWEAPSSKDKGWSEAAWSGKGGWGETGWGESGWSKEKEEEKKPKKGRRGRGEDDGSSKWKVKNS